MGPVNNRTKLILYLSDFSHIGGALTLCPLQLRLQVLLFSSQLQGRRKDERNAHKTKCLKSEQLNIDNMRRVKKKADIFQFRCLSKSFDLLLQRCNSLAHLTKETQECTIKVYKMQGSEHISSLVFSLELIAHWKPEHTHTSPSSPCDCSSFILQRDSSCSTLLWRRCKIPSCKCNRNYSLVWVLCLALYVFY